MSTLSLTHNTRLECIFGETRRQFMINVHAFDRKMSFSKILFSKRERLNVANETPIGEAIIPNDHLTRKEDSFSIFFSNID